MRKLWNLTKRNCLVFLRDRGAVFFSLLSMLIVLMLMGVFLGNMNVESVTGLLKEFGGARDVSLDKENATHLVQYWTLAGILIVNAVTVTITVIGIMINDSSENRIESFYSSPISRNLIAVSYIMSAVMIGTLFCALTLGIAIIYIVATGGAMLSGAAILKIFAYMILNVTIYAIIMFFFALFVKSPSAWSGIATVVGTLVGFVGAIYLPMGELPQGVTNVLKCLPVLHGAALMRDVCCDSILADTFEGIPAEVVAEYKEHMGISVVMNDAVVSAKFEILFILICGMIALGAVICIVQRKNVSDR